MTRQNKRAMIILFMALAMAAAIGSRTIALWLIWKAKPLPYRLISFMSTLISLRTVEAAEAAAAQGAPEADRIEYKSEGLRDPFQEEKIEEQPQEQVETKPLPALQIQGMVWGGSFPQAIINNKVVRVGDTIEGVRITEIDRNGVIVFFENRQYNLSTSSPKGGKYE